MNSHEIDYKIIGDDIQLVEVELDPHESVIAEAGMTIIKSNISVIKMTDNFLLICISSSIWVAYRFPIQ